MSMESPHKTWKHKVCARASFVWH